MGSNYRETTKNNIWFLLLLYL